MDSFNTLTNTVALFWNNDIVLFQFYPELEEEIFGNDQDKQLQSL